MKIKNGCLKCKNGSEKIKKTLEEVKKYTANLGLTLLSDSYINNKSKISVLCSKHGEFKTMFNSVQQGHGCYECGIEKSISRNISNKTPISTIKRKVLDMEGKLISKEYFNVKSKIKIKCKNNHIFKMTWSHVKNGSWCPKCKRIISSQEKEILEYLKQKTKSIILTNDRKILKGMELDIFIPAFNFGIEFDGLYWHSERNNPKIKLKVQKKIKAIKESKIKILGIYEDEWTDPIKKAIILSMIDSRIGLSKNIVYARKTKLVEVSKKEAKEFMLKNHLEGHTQFKKAIGLVDDKKELLMCLTLRSSKGRILEIARMASKLNFNVVGGASKLISSIKEPLMSYSDNRVGNGEVYSKIGFKEITQTFEPSYWYTDFKIRVFRTKCQRKKDLPGTEREQALKGAFGKYFGHFKPVYRIYGYGQRKWMKY